MNHKSFFNELKSLKSFMNDKEEIVTKINEDIAAEFKIIYSNKISIIYLYRECEDFMRNIQEFIKENIRNEQDGSVFDKLNEYVKFFEKVIKLK